MTFQLIWKTLNTESLIEVSVYSNCFNDNFRSMKGFEMIEMILSIIACGLAWKMQSRETRVVAQKLGQICESVITQVNDYVIKEKTNLFSTNTTGNEHFKVFGDTILKELEILDIKQRINEIWIMHKEIVNEEGKRKIEQKFNNLIAKEFDKYMELYITNEIQHIEESLSSENVFNMTDKEVPQRQNIVKWVANGPKFNPFVQKRTKKLIEEFDQYFCDSITMLVRHHDKNTKATFNLERGMIHD